MPVDEPDAPSWAEPPALAEPGRHRHARPGAPDPGFPPAPQAPPRGAARARHARPADRPAGPYGDGHRDGNRDGYRNGTHVPPPYRAGSWPATGSTGPQETYPEPAVNGADGRNLRHRPDGPRRAPDPPPAPVLPDRRPGDPPGVPAELFVETTAETRALRLDDLPPLADDPVDAEPAEDASADDQEPRRRGRAAGRRYWPARLLGFGHGRDRGPAVEFPAGHGHGHGSTPRAGRQVRILIAALLVPCALAALVGMVLLWPAGGPPTTAQPISQEPVQAQVTATRATDCTPGSGDGGCVALVVHMADGPRPDRDLVQVMPVEPGTPRFSVGDQVVLGWSGADPDDAGSYQVVDFQRGAPLAWLAGMFAVAVLLLGRWRGLAALAALALTFVVLLAFVVPAILAGRDPLAVAVVGACLIMFAVLYLTHGPSARTSTAVLGTLLSLALIGGLAAAFSAAAQLTGLDDQTSNLIASLGTGVDARGLLLAGVVIGALGVLDDVTVTQTSAVWELRYANPGLSARGLFTAAMRIGRDHVASAVNTLVLAYAGAALPLLLLFSLSGRGFGEVVTAQDVATEIVRTLVGSIGLVASVPITTAIAAAVAVREQDDSSRAEPVESGAGGAELHAQP